MIRILLANPNTSQSVTDQISAVAKLYASPGTEIVAVTARTAAPYVRQAETLAALSPKKALAGSFRRPEPKQITGVSPALARLFADPNARS